MAGSSATRIAYERMKAELEKLADAAPNNVMADVFVQEIGRTCELIAEMDEDFESLVCDAIDAGYNYEDFE